MKGPARLNQKRMVRYVVQGIALGAVATVLVLVFTAEEDTFEKLRTFPPGWLLLFLAMVVTAWLCNGARVWIMCRAAGHRLRYRQAIAVSLSTEFGIASTPAGVGGTVIRLTLLRQAGVPLTTAGSLLATDAAVDVVFFGCLAPFAVYILLHDAVLGRLLHDHSAIDALLVLAGLVVLVVALVLLVRSRRFHRAVDGAARATAFGRRKRLPARFRHLRMGTGRTLRRVVSSLAFLWRHRKGALLLNLTIASLQWCCRYMLLPLILMALGTTVNPLPLFLAQGMLFGLSLLVVAPGGGGSVELLTAFILPNLVPTGLVGVVVLVWRFFTYHLYVLGGGVMFFYVCHRLHRLFPGASEPLTSDAPSPAAP